MALPNNLSFATNLLSSLAPKKQAPSAKNQFLNSLIATGKGTATTPSSTLNSQNSSALVAPKIAPGSPSATSPKSTSSLGTDAAKKYMESLGGGTAAPLNPYNPTNGITPPETPAEALKAPSSYDTAKTDYTSAYKDYIASLTPSAELNAAKTKYNDYIASAQSGIKGIEGQGRGIPLTLVRGTQAKLADQAEIEAKRLQGEIDIASNADKSIQEGKLAGVNLQKDLLGLEKNPNDATDKPASVQEYEYAKKSGYTGSFTDYLNEDANRKKVQTGLTPAQVNSSVNQIAGAFDNEPVVREYNTVASTIKGLENAGASPTDDIQRIYAFAKIMDPNSAVREGEYKTIQDYSTALLQRLGINIQRAFDARGFLTADARNAMKTTLNNILKAKETAYKRLQSEYQRQIDDAYAGKNRELTDYTAGYSGPSGSTEGNIFAEQW